MNHPLTRRDLYNLAEEISQRFFDLSAIEAYELINIQHPYVKNTPAEYCLISILMLANDEATSEFEDETYIDMLLQR